MYGRVMRCISLSLSLSLCLSLSLSLYLLTSCVCSYQLHAAWFGHFACSACLLSVRPEHSTRVDMWGGG